MRILKAAAVSLLLVLPACSSVGPMLAGVGIAGASIAGKALVERTADNLADRKLWRLQKQQYIQTYASGILAEARKARDEGSYIRWEMLMDKLLAFHEEQYPDLLIVQYGQRLKKLEAPESSE